MNAQAAESSPLTIAIVKPCCIGDCVMALPAIQSLAAAFPLAHIHAFAGRHSAPVFRASEHVSRVYLSPDQLSASRLPGMAWNLRTAGHDWIVVLDRSRWLIAAARSAAPSRLVKLSSPRSTPRHEIDVYLDALRAVGVRTPFDTPHLTPGSDARESAAAALGNMTHEFVVLQPGGAENPGAIMLEKRWPTGHYVRLARTLAERGLRPVLTGGPTDVDLCGQIANDIADLKPMILAGRLDIMTTAAVIEKASLYIGADTGISHLAAAAGTPSIVIFGPTNPLRYAPRGDHTRILSPSASRTLADVDLRKVTEMTGRPSTAEVSVEHVIDACNSLMEPSTR